MRVRWHLFGFLAMIATPALAATLPFENGRYVSDPELCSLDDEQMVFTYGDKVAALTRLIEDDWISDSYEVSCKVTEVSEVGKDIKSKALCGGEGEEWEVEVEYTKVSRNAFRLYGQLFRRCESDAAIVGYEDGLDATTQEIVALYYDANSGCRGGAGNDPQTYGACGARDAYSRLLEERDWCWGQNATAGFQEFWAPCVSRYP